ncbi:ras GTPase-activating protein-binding protein [Achlya hypogyna]|uniref:Ras GTPase-activating protein-binding protein n=1 Tax=Achlya hypogyna TaxID=1202772 RepID=A0A1V9YQR1_ACHHY|nr:ras GTPase-activating protein-binding protein [Achlya hypogyna]
MSDHAASAVHPVTVGNTFVKQYYNLLTEAPQNLHRFYKDISRFSHATGSQMEEPISGQEAIKEVILGKNYMGTRVDLDNGSIDCHASQDGGVIVMVTGIIKLKNAAPTHFVQTFFLAVQPNGYFVLNDVLRFLEVSVPRNSVPVSPAKKLAPAPSPSKSTQTAVAAKEQATSTASHTPTNTPTHAKVVKSPKQQAVASPPLPPAPAVIQPKAAPLSPKAVPASPVVKPASPAAKPATPVKKTEEVPRPESPKKEEKQSTSPKAAKAKQQTPKQKAPVEEAPAAASPSEPKSWASLFGKTTAITAVKAFASSPAPVVESPRKQPAASWSEEPAEAATLAPAATGKPRLFSVFISNLPSQTTEADLRQLFGSFGKIASVTVTGRGYAFVDYLDPEHVKAVLSHGTNFVLHDQVLAVVERSERNGARGGFREGGRGRGARGDGGRGESGRGGGRNSTAPRKESARTAPAPGAKDTRKTASKSGARGPRPAQTN